MGNDHRTVIFGNGTLKKDFLKILRPDDYIIGVDRAAYWLLKNNIIPDLAIGDFDSTSPYELKRIKERVKTIKIYPKNKNFTDMELAIRQAKGEVYIFGGSGTRLDHTMATLFTITTQICIDETNRTRKISKGRTILKPGGYRYVSILPITSSIVISLSKFKYNLTKTKILRGSTRGISNEFAGRQAVIRLFTGKAWVIESRD
ncbi:MAG: thiamine diphosphokinase [Candidatus Nealsonbacteria bacterium RIFOXYC1_FULL_40_7]|uniref:Thiamine diphosphokinase n=2 Tax=Patescibacteria group TaxID=1783273 RepID=A0A1G2ERI9_9BACT|nr:MAG: thiamine diphosphokinase [Candidatus Gottesmanbacteria bacterium RIFOXYB1_FULL_47_11]OGZ27970.1 MAG: thiamine diphosphokinase [Candidatus Nealsonbacteria bacterium RIFOXYC1_FULL_40_7]